MSRACLIVASSLLCLAGPAYGQTFDGRVGVSSDGNIHDPDDIGAAPFSVAIVAAAGAKYVHHDYNCHIGRSTKKGEKQMTTSVLGAAKRFIGDTYACFDAQKKEERKAAIANIAKQINASTAEDRFYYCCGGPMHVPWEGIMASDPAKRKFCTVISHSKWNDRHQHETKTWKDIKKTGVKTVHITDQNKRLNTKKGWGWMKKSSDANLRWLYSRMVKFGDVSDSGMVYYVVTGLGDEHGTPKKLRKLFKGIKPAAVQ